MAPPKKEETDFKASDLLATQKEQGDTLSDLSERLERLESYLDTPQKLAEFFEQSSKDSRRLDGVFADMFCRFMRENAEVKAELEERIEAVDRQFFYKTFKKVSFALYTVAVVVGTLVVQVVGQLITQWVSALLPHAK